MAYRYRYIEKRYYHPEQIRSGIEEIVKNLQQPGVVVAFKEDILALPQKREMYIVPNSRNIPFNVSVGQSIVDICQRTGIAPSVDLSSKFAQAGFDFTDLSYKSRERTIEGRLANVGPRSFMVPIEYEVPFGFLYAKSPGVIDEATIDHYVDLFQKVNKNNNYFKKIQHPNSLDKHKNAIFIEMDRLLHFKHISSHHIYDEKNAINLAELHRGTERDLLHKQLHIIPAIHISNPDPTGQEYYSLMESPSPIQYPKNSGIVIIGGAFMQKDGTVEQFFDHGDSVVGQHRDPEKSKKYPSHTLIGEFYMPFQEIQNAKKRELKVGLVCEPVTLFWANQQGILTP